MALLYAGQTGPSARYASPAKSGPVGNATKRAYHGIDGSYESDRIAKKPRDQEAYERAKGAFDAFHSGQIRPLRPVYGNAWREGLRSVIAGTHEPAPAPVDEDGNEIKHPWYKPTRKSAAELRADMVKWGEAIDNVHGDTEKRGDVKLADSAYLSSRATRDVLVSGSKPMDRTLDVCLPSHGWTAPVGVSVLRAAGKAPSV